MQFRITAPHHHQAVRSGSTFSCTLKRVATPTGLAISWCVRRNDQILKDDCRTLNEAKNLCRATGAGP